MICLLAAVLQIFWSGVGIVNAKVPLPVIVANPPAARIPYRNLMLFAIQNKRYVSADFHTVPSDAIDLSGPNPIPTTYRGPFTIHARFGASTATALGFSYNTASVGCYANSVNGLRFDDDGVAHDAGTPAESDIYVTGPAQQRPGDLFSGCFGSFIRNGEYEMHAPYGATVIPRKSGKYFGFVRPSDFRGDLTIVPPLRTGDILLLRTANGRIVKMLNWGPAPGFTMVSGAYLAARPTQDFLDDRTYHPVKPKPHALFGSHSH